MRRPPTGSVAAAAAACATVVTMSVMHDGGAKPSYRDRLAAACSRPGYELTDFSRGQDLDGAPLPAGVTQVECSTRRLDQYGLPVDVYRARVGG